MTMGRHCVRKEVKQVVENIQKPSSNSEAIINIISVLEKIKKNEFVSDSNWFSNDLEKIIERLKEKSFRLAVVGEFSSGKSTFLNALIGKDILKHGARETTATVTEIWNDPSVQRKILMDVYYINGEVQKGISADKITEYTSTSSTTYHVAGEIEKVIIKSRLFKMDFPVCLVDTPGLNGIADNHREKTIEQIKNAHACIYMMSVRGLGQSDITFLKFIGKYQHNIIFVQNFIDELKRLEEETPEKKIEEQKKIITDRIFQDNPEVHYDIVAVSSRKALISRSESFKEYQGERLTDELRNKLFIESKFAEVQQVITDLMRSNEKEEIQKKDAVAVALNLLKYFQKIIQRKEEMEKENWDNSEEGRNRRNYTDIFQFLTSHRSEYFRRLNDFVDSDAADIKKCCMKCIENKIDEIEKFAGKYINEMDDIDKLVDDSSAVLPNLLYENILKAEEEIKEYLRIRFENLISNGILRINKYTEAGVVENDYEQFAMRETGKQQYRDFSSEEDKISSLRQQISEKKVINAQKTMKANRKVNALKKIQEELEAKEEEKNRCKAIYEREIKDLGNMPEKETKYKSIPTEEYRGGFGFFDWLFGPRIVTKSVPYLDDSRQREWKKKKAAIEAEYRPNINRIDAEKRELETKKKQYEEEINHIRKSEPQRREEIEKMEELLKREQQYLQMLREKVRQEYLRELKRKIVESMHEYLQNYIKTVFVENFKNMIKVNKNKAKEKIQSVFENSFDQRIKELEARISKVNWTKQKKKVEELSELLESAEIILEEYLCQKS